MNGSYQIGTAFGIPIRLHWSFLLIVILFWGQPWAMVALFGSVLLHELGHSLVAQHFGVRVVDITLWPLGGMARLSAMPEVPRIELLVALAGPAVNMLIAGITGPLLLLSAAFAPVVAQGLFQLFFVNVMLGVFNLVPAFPMDGGRVLRAWLARGRDWVGATETAVRIGRYVALTMIAAPILSLFLPAGFAQLGCMLPVIGLFILFAGLQELVAVRLRHGVSPIGGDPFAAAFRSTAERAAEAEAHWHRQEQPEPEPAEDEPPRGARRPRHWDGDPAPKRRHGFDEDRIQALERFHGRLRRPSDGDGEG